MNETKYPLKTAIKAYGEEVTELTMRDPTPADARALKALPYVIGKDESVSLNLDVCAKYIERLCSIPPSSVDQIDLKDFNTLSWAVASFFFDTESAA